MGNFQKFFRLVSNQTDYPGCGVVTTLVFDAPQPVSLVPFVCLFCVVFDGDSCDPDPCVNGTCVDLVLDYRCDCDPGFSGRNCSSELKMFYF